jgi:hypothetical protein
MRQNIFKKNKPLPKSYSSIGTDCATWWHRDTFYKKQNSFKRIQNDEDVNTDSGNDAKCNKLHIKKCKFLHNGTYPAALLTKKAGLAVGRLPSVRG